MRGILPGVADGRSQADSSGLNRTWRAVPVSRSPRIREPGLPRGANFQQFRACRARCRALSPPFLA